MQASRGPCAQGGQVGQGTGQPSPAPSAPRPALLPLAALPQRLPSAAHPGLASRAGLCTHKVPPSPAP